MISEWSNITLVALQNVWQGALMFLPKFVIGLLVFGIGWMIAAGVGKIIARILKQINFDSLFEKSGWKTALEAAEIKVNPSEFIGAVIKWILVIVFLQIFVEILGLGAFAIFLTNVLEWLPNVIVAAAIFVVSIIVADILEKVIKASVRKLEIKYSNLLGAIVRGSIYTFAILAILLQLGVAESIINSVIMGFVGMFALAFGLAFGLGGKDAAADAIRNLKNRLNEK
jgi:Conserved TM helix